MRQKKEHCARDHAQKSGLLAAYHRASSRTTRHDVIALTATVSLWNTTFGGYVGKKPQSGCAQFVEKVRLEATEQAFGRANRGKF